MENFVRVLWQATYWFLDLISLVTHLHHLNQTQVRYAERVLSIMRLLLLYGIKCLFFSFLLGGPDYGQHVVNHDLNTQYAIFMSKSNQTIWRQARNNCHRLGYRLLWIEGKDEMDFIIHLIFSCIG